MTSFESFLRRYLPLLGVLSEAEVVYVGTSEARLEAARTVFERTTQGSLGQIDFVPFEIEFREREQLEQGIQEATLTQLERLRVLRKSRLAPLFDLWKAQGRAGIEALLLLKPTRQNAASAVFLRTSYPVVIPFYEHAFGTRAANPVFRCLVSRFRAWFRL